MDRIQPQPEYRVPDNIAWVDGASFGMAEELYLTVVPDGRTVLLKDTARLIWLVASEGGNVLDEVADLVGRAPAEIEKDVTDFLADLTARGLLAEPGEEASAERTQPAPGISCSGCSASQSRATYTPSNASSPATTAPRTCPERS